MSFCEASQAERRQHEAHAPARAQRAWASHYDPGVPATIAYPEWTLPDLLSHSAARFPDQTALFFYGARISFRKLDEWTASFARALCALGVSAGDRVAIMLPNIPQALIAYYGALKAGAMVVQINPLYVAEEIKAQLVNSGSTTIVALDQFFPRIQTIREHTPLRQIILTNAHDCLPPLRRWLAFVKARLMGQESPVERRPLVCDFLTLLKTRPDGRATLPSLRPDDLALLQYTGGTTGTPKGVMLSHRNMVVNTVQCRQWVPDLQEGREVFLGVIPFFHAYGLSTCQHLAVMTGCPLILLPRFQATEVLQAIHHHRVTIFSGIPAMFMLMSESPSVGRYDLRSLRVCLSGASPLRLDVRDRFERLTGVKISEGYGLTEASPVTHCNPIYGARPSSAIGLPFPDTDSRVVDLETGEQEVARGEAGELLVRGPQVMQGYWKNEAETREVLRDGWLHTGDIVTQDDSEFFHLVDRKKDMIKSRGENVYPRHVEAVLLTHPAVQDVVVAGITHRRFGEAIKAYVVLKDGQTATARDLIGHCRLSLASFKVPTTIEFRQTLPRTVVGKVLRRMLRDEEESKTVAPERDPHEAG